MAVVVGRGIWRRAVDDDNDKTLKKNDDNVGGKKKTGWLGEMGERQRQRSRSDLVHKHTFATYTQIGRDFFRHFLSTSLSGD